MPRTPLASLLLTASLLCVAGVPSPAEAADPVFETRRGVAIRGTDPVAYFREGKPVAGLIQAADGHWPAVLSK